MFVKKIYKTKLRKTLFQINSFLERITFDDKEINAMYKYAVKHGKRFRPLLMIIACQALQGKVKHAFPACIAIELLHKASLIHDDLIDHDTKRRRKTTFFKKYGERKAVIMGDLLTSLAFKYLSNLNQSYEQNTVLACFDIFFETFNQLSIGEMKDICYEDKVSVTYDQSLHMSAQKSAVFIQNSLKIGAILGNGSQDQIESISKYGHNIGMAFQLINDFNNFKEIETHTGKQQFADICLRKKTPFIIHALEICKDDKNSQLIKLLNQEKIKKTELKKIVNLLSKRKVFNSFEKKIDKLLNEAKRFIEELPETPSKQLLLRLPQEAKEKWFWIS